MLLKALVKVASGVLFAWVVMEAPAIPAADCFA